MIERREIPRSGRARRVRLHELVIELWTRARTLPEYDENAWLAFVALGPLGDIEGLLGMPRAIPADLRESARLLERPVRVEALRQMLHTLWTIAGGNQGYNKADWNELQPLCGIGEPDPAVLSALTGIDDSDEAPRS